MSMEQMVGGDLQRLAALDAEYALMPGYVSHADMEPIVTTVPESWARN
jgi:hypothetical protein